MSDKCERKTNLETGRACSREKPDQAAGRQGTCDSCSHRLS